jgi:hypothetical protein
VLELHHDDGEPVGVLLGDHLFGIGNRGCAIREKCLQPVAWHDDYTQINIARYDSGLQA